MEFTTQTRVHPLTIVKMVQGQPQRYQMQGATHLKFSIPSETVEKRFVVVGQVLDSLLNGHKAA
jgi:transcription-repair coupling factor (superfamily II helicase)